MTNFWQAAEPGHHSSCKVVFRNEHPEDRLGIAAEDRSQRRGHAERNENSGRNAHTPAQRKKLAPVEEPFFSGLVFLLFLFPFFAGDTGGLLILGIAWLSL